MKFPGGEWCHRGVISISRQCIGNVLFTRHPRTLGLFGNAFEVGGIFHFGWMDGWRDGELYWICDVIVHPISTSPSCSVRPGLHMTAGRYVPLNSGFLNMSPHAHAALCSGVNKYSVFVLFPPPGLIESSSGTQFLYGNRKCSLLWWEAPSAFRVQCKRWILRCILDFFFLSVCRC